MFSVFAIDADETNTRNAKASSARTKPKNEDCQDSTGTHGAKVWTLEAKV